jgi:hypothetical protein
MERKITFNRVRRAIGGIVLVLFGAWLLLQWNAQQGKTPEEVQAGLDALYEKFSGPGYFHVELGASNTVSRYDVPRARVEAQMDRVLAERKLGTNYGAELERLVQRHIEPSKSRATGEPHVNLLRLNLALDERFKSEER